ncbi:DHHC palmitoyltransferase-domain-containing protein [Mortierella sp. GBAus27b]|nr:Palmitoyltransferase [Mortierella sp. GBA43]KAI8353695.1 DHHC palmitoyltransferase-domain-containing protein [Mortierella sp. GBAus27b]
MQFTGSRYIVAGVTLLITYISVTSQVFVFIPWLWTISLTRTLQVLVPFNIGVGMIFWNYYLACTTDPGATPPGWGAPEAEDETNRGEDKKDKNPSGTGDSGEAGSKDSDSGVGHSTAVDHHGRDQQSIQHKHKSHDGPGTTATTTAEIDKKPNKKKTPLPRYCRNCEAFKPPRSHHCRICKRCVLKMDHHCPWINNCVGHFNYGHFVRFITWVTLTTAACFLLLLWRVFDAVQNEVQYMFTGEGPTKTHIIFMAVNIVVDGGVLLAVGILTGYHLWSMISNMSTIEVWEMEKVDAMIKKGKIRKVKYPYNVGCLPNYRQVLGHNMFLWLWPQQMLGSGTEYEVIRDKDAALIWPPREYQSSKKESRTFVSEYTSSSLRQRQPTSSSKQGTMNHSKGQDKKSQGSGAARKTHAPPNFPTHVRRGSEGWIVQDLTVQQRADLYDRQVQYQREHGDQQGDQSEDEEYQEGLSDLENNSYGGLPGGMQGNQGRYDEEEEEEEEEEDLPYDVASDEYDDDYDGEYGYDDEYQGEDEDDLDHYNPYLAYGEEEEEETENVEEVGEIDDDEVTLYGQDRHKIGRFFDHLDPSGTSPHDVGTDSDEWDEGEGVDVGCKPPIGMKPIHDGPPSKLQHDPNKKTLYTMLVEREQELKKQTQSTTSK